MTLVKLDGWSKVGDRYSANGRWTLYRHKGREFDDLSVFASFEAEEADRASTAYQKESEKVKRGGLWLVAPDGLITAQVFVRPTDYR
jgi:hypothetical protein